MHHTVSVRVLKIYSGKALHIATMPYPQGNSNPRLIREREMS